MRFAGTRDAGMVQAAADLEQFKNLLGDEK
jgi:hypothetical protein